MLPYAETLRLRLKINARFPTEAIPFAIFKNSYWTGMRRITLHALQLFLYDA